MPDNHGGPNYEQLVSNGQLILQLHSFKAEHHHGAIADAADKPYGNGLLLWFEVDDFDRVVERASGTECRNRVATASQPSAGRWRP